MTAFRTYTYYVSELDMTSGARSTMPRCSRAGPRRGRGPTTSQKTVPSLVQAMFTGFPGNSGETVKITIPPEPKQARAY